MARHWVTAVSYGMIASILIVLASAFLLASLLRFTSFAESSGTVLPIVISLVSLFIGGVIAGSKMKEKGLAVGTVTGLMYCLFSLFFQFLGLDRAPGSIQYIFFAGNIVSCALGGALGVNLFSGRR
ncbi:TIGR04086 family membrane protein [Sporolactobacillus sp. THM7-7]|nr:TIGR04086 family membrane protein [Sporolactobacillus sp. THM7-7]